MYTFAKDITDTIVVGLFTGSVNSDDDYEQYIASYLVTEAKLLVPCKASFILVVDEGNPIPPASWRKRFAESTTVDTKNTWHFSLVTPSVVVRGVLVAINWLRPPPFQTKVSANIDEAIAWHEKMRQEALRTTVLALLDACRRQLR